MTELKTVENDNQSKKERFEFVLTINDNIVCQRYFRINGYKDRAAYSDQLRHTVHHCVEMIKNDLSSKSRVFLWYTCPKIFKNVEEMNKWVEHLTSKLDICTYIVFEDSEDVYIWNGEGVEPYNGYFNRNDYVHTSSEQPCTLKFTMLDNGKEIISEIWDGNQYPRFVRSNIDLSNSKNRYESRDSFSPFEASLVKLMIDGRQDLIPQIVRELCLCCSNDTKGFYTTRANYGNKTYSYNVEHEYNKEIEALGSKLKKKTERYLNTLY